MWTLRQCKFWVKQKKKHSHAFEKKLPENQVYFLLGLILLLLDCRVRADNELSSRCPVTRDNPLSVDRALIDHAIAAILQRHPSSPIDMSYCLFAIHCDSSSCMQWENDQIQWIYTLFIDTFHFWIELNWEMLFHFKNWKAEKMWKNKKSKNTMNKENESSIVVH